LPPGAALI